MKSTPFAALCALAFAAFAATPALAHNKNSPMCAERVMAKLADIESKAKSVPNWTLYQKREIDDALINARRVDWANFDWAMAKSELQASRVRMADDEALARSFAQTTKTSQAEHTGAKTTNAAYGHNRYYWTLYSIHSAAGSFAQCLSEPQP